RCAMARRIPLSGSAGPASTRLLAARSTSPRVMVPAGPVAWTRLRSTSSLCASARTAGSTCRVRTCVGSGGTSRPRDGFSTELTNNCSGVLLPTFGKLDEGCPHFDQIAFGAEQVCNATAPWGRNLHHRLIGLDRHKWLISDNMITLINVPSDNLSLFEAFT